MEGNIISVILLGLVCGAVARMLIPGDAFEHMSGPVSWLLSIVLGLIGALLGYWVFTALLGIGDTQKFDWGGIIGALIGSLIVVGIASAILNRGRRRTTV
ncbi:MAG: GlsB/YeaQ/YmgE family stress response membrane protein [Candidatus Nanopelagicales bacterium]